MAQVDNHSVMQVGIVVRDIEAAVERYCALFGVERPKIRPAFPDVTYEGKPLHADAKLCSMLFGNVTLELVQPGEGPSSWKDFLEEHGEGVHQIGVVVDDLQEAYDAFAEQGGHVRQFGAAGWGSYSVMQAPDIGVFFNIKSSLPYDGKNMVLELNHVGIKTSDYERSLKLYHEILGGKIVRDANSLDGKSRFVYLQLGEGIIELIGPVDPSDTGFAHVAYTLDGPVLDAFYERLTAMGIVFNVKPKKAGSGDGRLAFAVDPAGIVIELIEREFRAREPFDANAPRISCIVLDTDADLEACTKFYKRQLGFTACENGLLKYGADCVRFHPGKPAIHCLCVEATDVPAIVEKLRAEGFAVEQDDDLHGMMVTAHTGEKILLVQR